MEEQDQAIRFENITKVYPGGNTAVSGLSINIPAHQIRALVGASGSGKSTILRMVNRLVEPTSGQIFVDGSDISHVDPVVLRRRIGYVIQHVGLFPHRTVAQNIATVPSLLRWDQRRTREAVAHMFDLIGLDQRSYARRYPHQLSGGERQRVGVARALVTNPPVLLMDEPFGAVDPAGRRRLQDEFRRIQQELRTTVVFVTHDIDEAIRLGDQITVLSRGGIVEQTATPLQLLASPDTDVVREFLGDAAATRLLSVVHLTADDIDRSVTPDHAANGASLRIGDSLATAFAALLTAPQPNDAQLPVRDDHGHIVGVMTARTVLTSLRAQLMEQEIAP